MHDCSLLFLFVTTRGLSVLWDVPGGSRRAVGKNLSTRGLCSKDMLCFWKTGFQWMVAFFCLLLVSACLSMFSSTCVLYVVMVFWESAPSQSDVWNLINQGLNSGLTATNHGTVGQLLLCLRLLLWKMRKHVTRFYRLSWVLIEIM